MKTLVVAKHAAGPAENGHDNCYARAGNNGMCPGLGIADCLNRLGDDDEQYIKWPSGKKRETNGDVRRNWLRNNDHIVALEPHVARLTAERSRLQAELRRVNRKLKDATKLRCGARSVTIAATKTVVQKCMLALGHEGSHRYVKEKP
jgi:hypothetical protein